MRGFVASDLWRAPYSMRFPSRSIVRRSDDWDLAIVLNEVVPDSVHEVVVILNQVAEVVLDDKNVEQDSLNLRDSLLVRFPAGVVSVNPFLEL